MSNRITQKDIEGLTEEINELTGSPKEYSSKGEGGKRSTNIGHYHLNYAYGGVKLVRTVSSGGGIRAISHDGYDTKKKLYSFMLGFAEGLSSN